MVFDDMIITLAPRSVTVDDSVRHAERPANLDVFDLTRLSAQSRGWLEEFLAGCDFDFSRVLPGLTAAGKLKIRVTEEPMSGGVGGWASTDAQIDMNTRLGKDDYQAVFGMESAHEVNFFLPRFEADYQPKIIGLFHPAGSDRHQWFGSTPYFDQVGEAWTTTFVWSFSRWRPDPNNYTHATTPELAAALRTLLGGTAPPVPPTPPVPPIPPVPPTHPSFDVTYAVTVGGRPATLRGTLAPTADGSGGHPVLVGPITGVVARGGLLGGTQRLDGMATARARAAEDLGRPWLVAR